MKGITSDIPNDILAHLSQWMDLSTLAHWISTPPLCTSIRVSTHLISIDEALQIARECVNLQCTDRGWTPNLKVHKHPVLSDALIVEMSGPHPSPILDKYVVVDCSGAQALMRGADLFKAGIRAMTPDIVENDAVSLVVDVNDNCLNGALEFHPQPILHVGNGISRVSRNEMFVKSVGSGVARGIGVEMTRPLFQTVSESYLPRDLFFIQNISSMLPAHSLRLDMDSQVLDMCAAPGGKTTSIASLLAAMGGGGRVHAIDRSLRKVQKIKDLACRLKLDSRITCHLMDALESVKKFGEKSFDRILLDPSCSGVGQRPILKWARDMNFKSLSGMPAGQKRLFDRAYQLLRPGGILVYSTCTINPEENELIVSWALTKYSRLKLIKCLPDGDTRFGSPGLSIGGLGRETSDLLIRYDHLTDVASGGDNIGFFLATFQLSELSCVDMAQDHESADTRLKLEMSTPDKPQR
eukprot:Partr_v1_DN27184_c0_g1_i2_m16198 putative Nucleolar protein